MNANLARSLGALALVAALATWVAFKLHWETITVPTPAKGEALTNPYYALEHFVANLGIHPQEISTVRGLQPEAVLVLEEWGDELTHPPVGALESWVEAGGRLVISSALLESYPALRAWSGIKRARATRAPADGKPASPAPAQSKPAASPPVPPATTGSGADCPLMTVRADGAPTGQSFRVCDVGPTLAFDGQRAPAWSLEDNRGMHVIRTGVGFGEITVLEPPDVLSNAMLKRADHAEMFAAAAGLRHDDTLLIFHPATAVPLPVRYFAVNPKPGSGDAPYVPSPKRRLAIPLVSISGMKPWKVESSSSKSSTAVHFVPSSDRSDRSTLRSRAM